MCECGCVRCENRQCFGKTVFVTRWRVEQRSKKLDDVLIYLTVEEFWNVREPRKIKICALFEG